MKPRQKYRGKKDVDDIPQRDTISFNEAAAKVPRKITCHDMPPPLPQSFNEAAAKVPRKMQLSASNDRSARYLQ